MNLSDTARLRTLTLQRAVVYDGDVQRAERVGEVLRTLGLEPLLIDHSALMRAVIQAPSTPPALLIGDVADCDWRELCAALRGQLGDVPVVAYGSAAVADQLLAALGPRLQRLQFPFKHTVLAAALRVPVEAALEEAGDVSMPTGSSAGVREVTALIRQVAAHDSSVLILGESGTGKELAARAIHDASPRRQRPFVAINCGAIPAELLESELFGHVKGAFTGAIANRTGRFELAEDGTLFLDEIGDMSPNLQVKILRALQERRFEPVGGTKTLQSNVRIIAATNIDLEEAVDDGRFREDLFYRLNVIPIRIPSLRERKSDIPLLLHHFIENFNRLRNRQLKGISADAVVLLSNYAWPGNIRELENLVERLAILKGSGIIDVMDLPEKYRRSESVSSDPGRVDIPDNGMDFNSAVDAYENALIMRALEKTGWNRNQAALLLKLNRTTLVEKIKKKGLRPADGSDRDL
jgi:transcriptional regulator with PAS, ATPase and Fis domain